jgi:hypothetical protein
MKKGPDALATAEIESGPPKHEKGPNALATAEIESGPPNHENRTRRPAVPLKTTPGALNIKTGPDTLRTAGI